MNQASSPNTKLVAIGWREWARLPDLGIDAIKFKTDTGARTSALHVSGLSYFEKQGQQWVRFVTHPLQGQDEPAVQCEAAVLDYRDITNSGGQSETRPVIETRLVVGQRSWLIRLSLTCRKRMKFRMLLGRRAMANQCWVDPAGSFLNGRLDQKL